METHSVHGQKVDIAIIEVTPPQGMTTYPINEMPLQETMRVEIGMDIFILGFPIKLFTGIFPVWKRATMATESDIPINGIPSFLVDSASRSGMSGSPVILRQRGSYTSESGTQMLGMASATRFLGIYSGRYGADDDDKAQLGIVWRKSLIEEIIADGVIGSYILI